jgi:Ca2+-binding RTX toxin-like protein
VCFDFTLADITLLDFSLQPDCTPPPPKLGGTSGGVLYLFAGVTNGTDTQRGAPWGLKADDAETWVVRQHGTTVTVQALGLSEDFTDVDTVVLDARNSNDKQRVIALFQGKEKGDVFSDSVVFFGGAGNDVVKTDTGPAFIDGGGGDDTISTGDRPLTSTNVDKSLPPLDTAPRVLVAGNGGDDHITVGNAIDTVAGDGRLSTAGATRTVHRNTDGDVSVTTVNPTGITLADVNDPTVAGTAGKDVLSVGLGGGNTYGGPAGDQIAVAQDSPLAGTIADETIRETYTDQGANIYGGTGPDRISGGAGDDKIFTGVPPGPPGYDAAHPENSQDETGTADLLGANEFNTADTGAGNDVAVGSDGVDLVTGHSRPDQTDIILGLAGADVLTGGDGTDRIFGGRGDDYLVSQPADVTLQGADTIDVLGTPAHPVTVKPNPNPANTKLLVGGGGSDRIFGGDGATTAFGDHVAVTCRQVGTNRSDGPDEDTSGYTGDNADGPDLIYGGNGADTIQAGGAADWVFAKGADDKVCGMRGDDHLYGGDETDTIWGGRDSDVVQGDGGTDFLYGNEGDDFIYGNAGIDALEGNGDADTLFGGEAGDVLIGGTSAAARADTGDSLYGDEGDDLLIGDNAKPEGAPNYPDDLSNTSPTPSSGGSDVIFGGDGTDKAYGGLVGDYVFGGNDADYIEGNNDADHLYGEGQADDIIGGSSETASPGVGRPDAGDTISGGANDDVIAGDNAQLARVGAGLGSALTRGRGLSSERSITLLDLGDTPTANTSGADFVHGNEDVDVILGQGDTDRLLGDDASDYAEGGPAADWIEGGNGSDDLVGGSSDILSGSGAVAQGQPDAGDVIWGQAGDDVVTGDNAIVTRVAPYNDLTFRIGLGSTIEERRAIRLLDLDNGGILNAPAAIRFGGDQLSGQDNTDVLLGQDGADRISGGGGDDYAEGQGADDKIWGDQSLTSAGITPPAVSWPGSASVDFGADGGADGQDDLIGGKSQPGFRDAGDEIHGNGVSDFVLGDNGTAVRDVQSDGTTILPSDPVPPGPLTNRIYKLRYPATLPVGAAIVRHKDPAQSAPTPRFCTTNQPTCEVAGAFGNDNVFGDDGDDFLYGQDGNDAIRGGNQDDDIFGELGDDTLFGEAGNDAILGDRGGVRDIYQTGSNHFFMSVTQVPKVEFDGFNSGDVTRVTDLLHDVDGDVFVGSGTQEAMPHPGLNEGGDDRIRGGTDHDSIHAAFGDDLANGDSGGDWVFGDDGADVLWGGKGCDASVDTPASAPICYPGGNFDPAPHTAAGETQPAVTDYLNGGKGGTSAASIAGSSGSDVLDWRPRGTYAPGTGCTTQPWPVDLNSGGKKGTSTIDPCSWFEMTDLNDALDDNNQHHQGVDWQYGGWDRDILQGDQADNGPNEGDRLLDWNGAYNLYTHCNAAYGGFNDVRQHSPSWQAFLQRWVWAQGAGQAQSDAVTAGTSAFVELALVYPGRDNAHGSGSAYPSTPGHFDDPNACAP